MMIFLLLLLFVLMFYFDPNVKERTKTNTRKMLNIINKCPSHVKNNKQVTNCKICNDIQRNRKIEMQSSAADL